MLLLLLVVAIPLCSGKIGCQETPEVCASSCNITDLVDYLQNEFISFEDGYNHMLCLKEYFLANRDKRLFFISLYAAVTKQVKDAIATGTYFYDNSWLEVYDYQFANLYREALLNWELGNINKVPRAWQLSFANAHNNGNILIWQHMLLAVNAHINNDLAQVISMMNITEDTDHKHSDTQAIDPIIMSVYKQPIPGLIDLYAPAWNFSGHAQQLESTVSKLESEYREKAWDFAFKLIDAPPFKRTLYVQELNLSAAFHGEQLLMFGFSDQLLKSFRELEGDQFKSFCSLTDWAC